MNRMATTLSVLSAGAAGTIVLWYTAAFYRGVDSLAFAVVCGMFVALFIGIAELLHESRRVVALREELEGLVEEPSLEGLEKSSSLLRSLLLARLDRVQLGVPRPSFTPYLIGLLVMLGLLGTFLGLFETLRGARMALTASGDLDALRQGLSTPMTGLMRSFGTSAAGVSASAMLGLAAVFSRRAGSGLAVDLHAAATGPFARFSANHRQLVALEQLAAQGESLPAAAEALTRASTEIESLRDEWKRAHAEASRRVAEELERATSSVSKIMEEGVAGAAKAAEGAMAPLVSRAVEGTVEAAGQHLRRIEEAQAKSAEARQALDASMAERLAAHLERVTDRLDAQHEELRTAETSRVAKLDELEKSGAAARAEQLERVLGALSEHAESQQRALEAHTERGVQRDLERAETWLEGLARVESALAERGEKLESQMRVGVEATLEALSAHASSTRVEEDARAKELTERVGEIATRLEAAFARVSEAEAERAALLGEHVDAMSERLGEAATRITEDERRRAELLGGHVDAMSQQMRQALEEAAGRDAERAETLASVAGTLRQELEAAAAVMRDRLAASADADAERSARAQAMFAELETASQRIAEAASSQSSALREFVEATEGRAEQQEERAQARLDALLERVSATVEAQSQRLGELEAGIREGQKQTVSDLASELREHANALGASLSESSKLVADAAGLVQAGGLELTAVAEMFATAVDRQRDAAREWLENLGHVERAVADAGEGAAADALGQHLARTHEIFDRQLRFQRELFDQLQKARNETVNGHAAVDPQEALDTMPQTTGVADVPS